MQAPSVLEGQVVLEIALPSLPPTTVDCNAVMHHWIALRAKNDRRWIFLL